MYRSQSSSFFGDKATLMSRWEFVWEIPYWLRYRPRAEVRASSCCSRSFITHEIFCNLWCIRNFLINKSVMFNYLSIKLTPECHLLWGYGVTKLELSYHLLEIPNKLFSQILIMGSSFCQVYCEPIGLYWEIIRRQLNTLTGFISITEGGQLTLTLSVDSL